MKILQVLVGAATRTGGPPAFVGEAAVELARQGADVRIFATDLAIAPWGLGRRQRRIEPDEIHPALACADTRLFPARFPRRMGYSPALARALRETVGESDVVHIHNLWQFPQYAAHRAARDAGIPYIVSPHGALDRYLRTRGRVRKGISTVLWQGEMLRGAALIHVTTEAERDSVADLAPGVPRAVVPCGVHTGEFERLPPPDVFRRDRLDGYTGPVILFLGRVTRKKGVDVLIRAFAEVRRGYECRLAVVGPDDEGILPGLRRLAVDLGVGDEVCFTGPAYGDQRLAALSSAAVWALASHTENFGIAVVEALAAGCAVVTSPGVDIAADLASANAGIVAEPSPRPFAEALLAVLTDDQRRAALRRNAQVFAGRYEWSVVSPQLLRMYRGVVAARGDVPARAGVG
ncbi:MAG TPA: glycosyltransferase [Solirubrobacterales bacterium]